MKRLFTFIAIIGAILAAIPAYAETIGTFPRGTPAEVFADITGANLPLGSTVSYDTKDDYDNPVESRFVPSDNDGLWGVLINATHGADGSSLVSRRDYIWFVVMPDSRIDAQGNYFVSDGDGDLWRTSLGAQVLKRKTEAKENAE